MTRASGGGVGVLRWRDGDARDRIRVGQSFGGHGDGESLGGSGVVRMMTGVCCHDEWLVVVGDDGGGRCVYYVVVLLSDEVKFDLEYLKSKSE